MWERACVSVCFVLWHFIEIFFYCHNMISVFGCCSSPPFPFLSNCLIFFFVSVISWVETFVNGSFIIVMVTMMLTTRSLYFYIDDVDGDQIHLKINSKWYGHSRSFFVRERIKSFSGRQKKKEKKKMKNLLNNKCRGQFSRSFFCRLLDVPLVQNGYS